MKTTLKSISIIILLAISMYATAKERHGLKNTTDMDTVEFQIGLISPIGTNGLESWNTVNKFSLNMYAGYAGGLDGFEASGFVGALRGDMNGAQFAGFVNADMGNSKGAQFAGFVNFNKGTMEGAQFAGFVNANTGNTDALQAAGFVNSVVGTYKGAQFAGFVNAATKETKGAQFSGFMNTVSDSIDGFQGTGFVNYSMGNSMGQASGFLNVNVGDCKGIQATGLVNMNTGKMKGAQLSGFANYTTVLSGTQISVFNFVDSVESGTPIGFLSFVRNGYHKFQLSTSETLYSMASFKTGTRTFYNILSLGGGVQNNTLLYGWGYGVGTIVDIKPKFNFAIEAEAFQVIEDDIKDFRFNMWSKLNIAVSYKINDRLNVFAAPTFNVVVSDMKDIYGERIDSSVAPFSIFTKELSSDFKVEMYPGFNLGILF